MNTNIVSRSYGILFCFLLFMLFCGTASGADFIGSVRTVDGGCFIDRNEVSMQAETGTHLYKSDILRTGSHGAMGVLLRDDTSLSMGPESEIILEDFVFDPANDTMGMAATFAKGTASVITGKISELAPESAKFSTPLITIGIRGTHFAVKVD